MGRRPSADLNPAERAPFKAPVRLPRSSTKVPDDGGFFNSSSLLDAQSERAMGVRLCSQAQAHDKGEVGARPRAYEVEWSHAMETPK